MNPESLINKKDNKIEFYFLNLSDNFFLGWLAGWLVVKF